ncbi:beta-glucosidase [Actinomyces ruminicola]|uniref:Beta-glucosidase n=1 Tax=Actinomyces ruminicola TaxID=332524 RepID=A0A1G9ZXW6_9ACTO|nr:glycoside hydrolase family 3 N-terminal domain-containing protein [Actinomyces ruminicola]SDN25975.1 beta-glucosidase [Actinomyces ruminicola]
MNQYEIDHMATVRAGAPESMVLLKTDGSFPLDRPGPLALFGAGARRTIKGGTGSGDVNSRHVVSIEEGLENAGFTITTKSWLDAYDRVAEDNHQAFVADLKAKARAAGVPAIMFGMGAVEPAPAFDLPLDGDGEAAIYVVARDSGEGNDRHPEAGDVKLTDSEIRDITALAAKFERFLLVLNVGGVVDLSPVVDVENILLLSQVGAVIGDAFADVLLGKSYPSGKLSTTWAAWEDYSTEGDFGDPDDTHYREGVYVGYRYFDSVGTAPLFPFGFGLGYTTFTIGAPSVSAAGSEITVKTTVTNTGAAAGKEVVQVYVSVPAGELDQPYQALVGFAKTGELAAGAAEDVTVTFDLTDLASYDAAKTATVLEGGDYVVRVGASSRNTTVAAVVELPETAVVRELHDALGEPGFTDFKPAAPVAVEVPAAAPRLTVAAADLRREDTQPPVDLTDALEYVKDLSDDELAYIVLGQYADSADKQSIIGQASQALVGAAGQTTTRFAGLPSLVMPDGPAGLRLTPQVGEDADGKFPLGEALGGLFAELMDAESIAALGGEVDDDAAERVPERTYEQYATAIPIGTAIAQSWNPELAAAYGDLVGAEMEHFGAHLWLAPAFNLHRTILCGRNFEYLSEDPLLAGRMAAGITRGVQAHPGRGVTVKHFAFNNQETNRLNSNSHVSQRAARDLYLRSFEIVIREAQPHAIMTSYNLVNGVHTSESAELLETILREEWGFQGLVMTDWVVRSMTRTDLKYPRATAAATIKAGNELFMPGCEEDRQDILAALRGEAESGVTLTRAELEKQAARVVRMAHRLGDVASAPEV